MEKAITKNQARLYTKLSSFLAECEELYGMKTVYHDSISIHTLKRLKSSYAVSKYRKKSCLYMEPAGEKHSYRNSGTTGLVSGETKGIYEKLYTLGTETVIPKQIPMPPS